MTTIQDYVDERQSMLDYIEYLENTIMVSTADKTTGHIEENEIMRKLNDERTRRLQVSNNG